MQHFFSHETLVSLELPAGWQVVRAEGGAALYADTSSPSAGTSPRPPRLAVKRLSIPTDDPLALESLADTMLELAGPGRQVLSMARRPVDGRPARQDVFAYRDDAGRDVTQYQAVVQIGRTLVSLTGMVEDGQREAALPLFEAAVDSVRFIGLEAEEVVTSPLVQVSVYHPGTRLSVRIPASWTVRSEERQFWVFAPPSPEPHSYRANMTFVTGLPEGEGEEWLEALFIRAGKELAERRPQFQQLEESRFALSSGVNVFARRYAWVEEDTRLPFCQLQALMLNGDDALYAINASTLVPLAERHMPAFDAVLRSIRLIPDRE